jgi:hypothetical protein
LAPAYPNTPDPKAGGEMNIPRAWVLFSNATIGKADIIFS